MKEWIVSHIYSAFTHSRVDLKMKGDIVAILKVLNLISKDKGS